MNLWYQFIVWMIASIGITHILTGSSIISPLRKFVIKSRFIPDYIKGHIQCNQCAGFWVGSFSWIIVNYFEIGSKIISLEYVLLAFLIYGPICSLMSDLAYRIKQFLCKECG